MPTKASFPTAPGRITLKRIADEAGVSVVTASFALKNNTRISEKRREQIQGIARRLGYRPSAAGRLLKSKNIQDIGLVVCDNAVMLRQNTSFYTAIIDFMTFCRRRHVPCQIEWLNTAAPEDPLPDLFTNGLAGGLVILGWAPPHIVDYLENRLLLPHVRVGEPGPWSVQFDNARALYQAVERVCAFGHRRLAFINGENFPAFAAAREGVVAGCRDYGLSLFEQEMGTGELAEGFVPAIRRVVDRFFALPADERPTALLCMSGLATKEFITGIARRGVLVPRDLSVVCFQTSEWEVERAFIPITAMESSSEKLIEPALNLLQARMEGRTPPETRLTIPATWFEGETLVRAPR